MSTKTATGRSTQVEEILGAFGMRPGGTVSGVAYGGRFKEDAGGAPLETHDPTTGEVLAHVRTATADDVKRAVGAAHEAFAQWRLVPAPQRGEIVRRLGDGFRKRKEDLARLISLENGKILTEARGEVQEVIDICDLAVGQSRQLFGREIASERRDHRLVEQWHPLGVVGIISAFKFLDQLVHAYRTIGIGDPLDEKTLMGPLISESAVKDYSEGLAEMQKQGGKVVYGGKVLADRTGYFVEPAIVKSTVDMPIVKEEVFAPILHVFEVDSLEDAVAVNNSVPQGLSSGLFTTDLASAERWLSASGSDCGISNVNAGTSGSEIGGAFGGEKATGGGRQAGSDAWKGYMRRQTNTINYGTQLPLAQGVEFPVD